MSDLTYELVVTPFSRHGSFFSVSEMTAEKENPLGPGVYLRTHHDRGGPEGRRIFKLDLATARRRRPAVVAGGPATVTFRARSGRGEAELLIDPVGTVRIRGRGTGFCLEMPVGYGVVAQPAPGGRWAFNARWVRRRYMLECLRGRVHMDARWEGIQCREARAWIEPNDAGEFEVALDEFVSTWVARSRRPFDAARRAVRSEFAAWARKLPHAAPALARTRELAAYVLWSAVVAPQGNFKRPAMLMSKRGMDQVWSWDHCFNAMALGRSHADLAWDQLNLMADWQDEFGCMPDAVNDVSMHYNYAKPPVHGWATRFLLHVNPHLFTPERLRHVYGWMGRQVDWWTRHRTWPGDPLPHYLHGNDSGWDNSTMFDRGCPLMAPDLAAILATQMDALAVLARKLGRAREAVRWQARSEQTVAALVKTLWRGDGFAAMVRPDGAEVCCDSLVPCIPLVLGPRLPEEVRRVLVHRVAAFVTPYGLATELPSSPAYNSNGYWRGPVWAPPTLLILTGLDELGETRLARRIAQGFARACRASGFAENFDALTGEGRRDRAYTWTASTFLLVAQWLKTGGW